MVAFRAVSRRRWNSLVRRPLGSTRTYEDISWCLTKQAVYVLLMRVGDLVERLLQELAMHSSTTIFEPCIVIHNIADDPREIKSYKSEVLLAIATGADRIISIAKE